MGINSRSLAAWNALGVNSTIRRWVPLLLLGVSGRSRMGLRTPRGEAAADPNPSKDKQPTLLSVSALSWYASSYAASLAPEMAIGARRNLVPEECSAPMPMYSALNLNSLAQRLV